MPSCMNCFHFNPCNLHHEIIVEKRTEGNDWILSDNVENECAYFTPTADVAEVVRCKDCKHCERINDEFGKDWYQCKRRGNFAQKKPYDFCSYGERNVQEVNKDVR